MIEVQIKNTVLAHSPHVTTKKVILIEKLIYLALQFKKKGSKQPIKAPCSCHKTSVFLYFLPNLCD